MSVTAIQSEIQTLPASERVKLIDFLWDSLGDKQVKSREADWAEESERRVGAFEKGELDARDATAIFGELRGKRRK